MGVTTSLEVQVSRTPEFHAPQHTQVPEQHVFAQLTALSSFIPRLSSADAAVFRGAFQQEAVCYAHSWLYLLRSTRNDDGGFGYKYVDDKTFMGIGYRNNTVYVVHPIGPKRFTATREVVDELRRRISGPIILKKIDQELYTYLSSTNLFQADANGSRLFEEEVFPEHLLPLPRLYNSEGGLYHRSIPFTRKVRRFERSSVKLTAQADIAGIENRPGFQHLFGPDPDKYKSYLQIIREVASRRPGDGTYKACAYSDENGTVHGLYISELLAEGAMGLYCAISSRSSPGITEWMDYDFFRRVFEDGIHTLYLGGSETAGVHAYVQKLLPIEPPYLQRPLYCNHNSILGTRYGMATSQAVPIRS